MCFEIGIDGLIIPDLPVDVYVIYKVYFEIRPQRVIDYANVSDERILV
jgi:tryptophan synthase alpha subunit